MPRAFTRASINVCGATLKFHLIQTAAIRLHYSRMVLLIISSQSVLESEDEACRRSFPFILHLQYGW